MPDIITMVAFRHPTTQICPDDIILYGLLEWAWTRI